MVYRVLGRPLSHHHTASITGICFLTLFTFCCLNSGRCPLSFAPAVCLGPTRSTSGFG